MIGPSATTAIPTRDSKRLRTADPSIDIDWESQLTSPETVTIVASPKRKGLPLEQSSKRATESAVSDLLAVVSANAPNSRLCTHRNTVTDPEALTRGGSPHVTTRHTPRAGQARNLTKRRVGAPTTAAGGTISPLPVRRILIQFSAAHNRRSFPGQDPTVATDSEAPLGDVFTRR